MTSSTNTGKGRIMTGKVISTSMTNTVIVQVVRTFAHKLYKKTVRKSHRFAAHNTNPDIQVGDTVAMKETKPISKRKHFVVVEKGA